MYYSAFIQEDSIIVEPVTHKPIFATSYGMGRDPETAIRNALVNIDRWGMPDNETVCRSDTKAFLDSLEVMAETQAYQDDNERMLLHLVA